MSAPSSRDDSVEADYLIETPLDLERVADTMAGEQSSGTFVRVANESDALRARSRACVLRIEELEPVPHASLPSAWLTRQRVNGPFRSARVTLSFPVANIGANLPTLAATLAGNLYDLGEVTGMRLQSVRVPRAYRERFDLPVLAADDQRRDREEEADRERREDREDRRPRPPVRVGKFPLLFRDFAVDQVRLHGPGSLTGIALD